MKRIVLVVLCASSLYAMNPAAKPAAPGMQKKEAHEKPHIQNQVNTLQDLIIKSNHAWQGALSQMAQKLAALEALIQQQEMRNQQNIVNIMTAFAQHKEQSYAQNNALVQHVHILETVIRAMATDLQHVLKSGHTAAVAPQAAACAQPQSFQLPKLTITVSGPEDQAPIQLVK